MTDSYLKLSFNGNDSLESLLKTNVPTCLPKRKIKEGLRVSISDTRLGKHFSISCLCGYLILLLFKGKHLTTFVL